MKKKIIFYTFGTLFLLANLFFLGRAAILLPKVKLQNTLWIKSPQKLSHAEFHPYIHDRVFICQKNGIIRSGIIGSDKNPEKVLDISDRVDGTNLEDGLLSLEFDPKFKENSFVYLFYIGKDPKKKVLSRFIMNQENFEIDPNSEFKIIELIHEKYGHNGGDVEFGPDNMLYVSFGDGFAFEGEHEKIQENYNKNIAGLKSFYGSIIRINLQSDGTYLIPEDNPFKEGKREIYAKGLRNPWRFSFHPTKKEIIVGDVGLKTTEEINVIEKGGEDFGWPFYEGVTQFVKGVEAPHPTIPPKGAFPYSSIRSIIGGFVYQGKDIPILQGKYIFGDTYRGVYAVDLEQVGMLTSAKLLIHKTPGLNPHLGIKVYEIASFAQDANKELYIVDYNGGLYKIVPMNFWEKVQTYFYQILTFW